MTNETIKLDAADNLLADEALGPARDSPVSTPVAIAAMAMTFAMKYHDVNTVQDGVLYQQYKMEGRNMRELNLDAVFHTATRIEAHLIQAEERFREHALAMVLSALDEDPAAEEEEDPAAEEDEK